VRLRRALNDNEFGESFESRESLEIVGGLWFCWTLITGHFLSPF
jgi:hypothetical protein